MNFGDLITVASNAAEDYHEFSVTVKLNGIEYMSMIADADVEDGVLSLKIDPDAKARTYRD